MADLSFRRRVMAILWPSFLMAGVLEALVFALVDPANLRWFGAAQVELSASAVYSLAFFVFWGVVAIASGLTQMLDPSADDIKHRPPAGGKPH